MFVGSIKIGVFVLGFLFLSVMFSVDLIGQVVNCKDTDYACLVDEYSKRLANNPRDVKALFERAAALAKIGKFDQEIADLDKLINLKPSDKHLLAKAHNNRGVAYKNKGNLSRALNDYDDAIRIFREDGNFFVNRGNLYQGRRQFDLALSDYSMAANYSPNDPEVYYDRAGVYYLRHDYKLAIADLDKYISLDPKNIADLADGYEYRGASYGYLNDLDNAVRDHSKAIELDPNAARYSKRGRLYRRFGKTQLADADDAKAKTLPK